MKPPDSNVGEPERLTVRLSNIPEVVIEPANPRRNADRGIAGTRKKNHKGKFRGSPSASPITNRKRADTASHGREIIHIWLPHMTEAMEAAIVIEVGKEAISWARKRMRRHSRSPKYIYIYAEDGRVLREIKVKDRRGDPEIIVPESQERTDRTRAPLRERACGNWRYALILARRFLKNTAVTVVQSPKRLISAILEQRRMRKQRRNLKLYEEQCNAVKIQKTLKRLVIEKIHPPYQTRIKLKENVTYGSDNETVQFETVLENEDGTPSKRVHIDYVSRGSRREETRRYMKSLAHFNRKIRDYERLTGHLVTVAYVLVAPTKGQTKKSTGCLGVYSL